MNDCVVFKPTLIASALAGACCLAPPMAVQAAQVGPQFVVASMQNFFPPAVASSTAGFVVGWATEYSADANGYHAGTAYIGSFAPDGTPRSANIALGSTSANPSSLINAPGVAMDADGDIVAAWVQPRQSTTAYGFVNGGALYAKRYSSTGTAQGDALRISGTLDYLVPILPLGDATLVSTAPQVAMDDAGDFVVAWSEVGYTGDNCSIHGCAWQNHSSKTYAASYRANNLAYKWKTQIDRIAPNPNKIPNGDELDGIALLNSGSVEFLFTGGQGGVAMAPSLKTFNKYLVKSGTPASLGITASPGTSTRFDAAGNVYVLWNDTNRCRISRFNPSGSSLGQDVVVNDGGCSLAVAPSGAFAVTWIVADTASEVDGQYFNHDGSSNGASFVIQAGDQAHPILWSTTASAEDLSSVESIVGRMVTGP